MTRPFSLSPGTALALVLALVASYSVAFSQNAQSGDDVLLYNRGVDFNAAQFFERNADHDGDLEPLNTREADAKHGEAVRHPGSILQGMRPGLGPRQATVDIFDSLVSREAKALPGSTANKRPSSESMCGGADSMRHAKQPCSPVNLIMKSRKGKRSAEADELDSLFTREAAGKAPGKKDNGVPGPSRCGGITKHMPAPIPTRRRDIGNTDAQLIARAAYAANSGLLLGARDALADAEAEAEAEAVAAAKAESEAEAEAEAEAYAEAEAEADPEAEA